MNKTNFIDLDNARVDEQKQVMRQIKAEDHCPFCRENLAKYHKHPVIRETKYWLLTNNQWPYENTKLHLLAIYKDHVTKLAGLDPAAGQDLLELMQWAEREYQVPGGGWAMRFGDTDYSAGTVAHIHAQFIVPDIEADDFAQKPVKVKIGKTKK
jgi:diadenosine tetraphosphate (Ap4A) HIT family hydrolase